MIAVYRLTSHHFNTIEYSVHLVVESGIVASPQFHGQYHFSLRGLFNAQRLRLLLKTAVETAVFLHTKLAGVFTSGTLYLKHPQSV